MKKKAKQLRKNLRLSRDLLRQLSNDELKNIAGASYSENTICGC